MPPTETLIFIEQAQLTKWIKQVFNQTSVEALKQLISTNSMVSIVKDDHVIFGRSVTDLIPVLNPIHVNTKNCFNDITHLLNEEDNAIWDDKSFAEMFHAVVNKELASLAARFSWKQCDFYWYYLEMLHISPNYLSVSTVPDAWWHFVSRDIKDTEEAINNSRSTVAVELLFGDGSGINIKATVSKYLKVTLNEDKFFWKINNAFKQLSGIFKKMDQKTLALVLNQFGAELTKCMTETILDYWRPYAGPLMRHMAAKVIKAYQHEMHTLMRTGKIEKEYLYCLCMFELNVSFDCPWDAYSVNTVSNIKKLGVHGLFDNK